MTDDDFDSLVKPHSTPGPGKTANGVFEPLRLHIGDGGFFITIMENQYLEKGKAVLMLNPEDAKTLVENYKNKTDENKNKN